FLWVKRMIRRTAQHAIGLGNKVMTFEMAALPGGSEGGQPIMRNWGGGGNRGRQRNWGGAGKLGATHSCGLERVPQFQAQVPDPLREDLPKLLPAGAIGTPAIRILFLILIREDRLKSSSMQVQFHDIGAGESTHR